MNGLRIEIDIAHPAGSFQPGDQLAGEFHVANCSGRNLRAAECSVLWYTVGKGDEDLHVHALERYELQQDGRSVSSCTQRFSFSLPPSPQSYDGVIVKVRWCVRVRVFLSGGQEVVSQTPIVLGHTGSARLAEPISELTA
jgi:hypothetical protein